MPDERTDAQRPSGIGTGNVFTMKDLRCLFQPRLLLAMVSPVASALLSKQ